MLDATTQVAGTITSQRQPRALYLLFFTELWERFGFYTLQTIIILYMTKGLLLSDHNANLLYAAFSALLYLTPTFGGFLADKYLGFERAIILGGFLFIVAYLACASPQQHIFFFGLGLLVCANGLFKPAVSSMVGELYTKNDPRRESGFTLFYMGCNIGALIPPLIAGYIVVQYGWHAGFILATIGMAFGQMIFLFGRKSLDEYTDPIVKKNGTSYFASVLVLLGALICAGLCQIAFRYPEITAMLVELAAVAIFLIVGFYLLKEKAEDRRKMIAALILIIISVAFWSLYNQSFTSLMLFSDRNMHKQFLGLPFDAEATGFFNPFFIIILSPILSRLYLRLDSNGFNPSIQLKFCLGVLFMGAGYLILAGGALWFGTDGMVSSWWICISYLFQTVAELLISPIGLAMITVLSPKHLVGMMMGVWFFAQAASFSIGGSLANLAAIPQNITAPESLAIYAHVFTQFGIIAVVMVILSLACLPILNKLTHNNN